MDGDKVYGTFWSMYDDYNIEPHIRVAAGDYMDLCHKWGKDSALTALLSTIAHELTHYFQWINALKLTPIGQEREINALSQKILDYVKNDTGFYWEIGEEDSDSCPKIIIESFIKDISGHIVLNASCQLQSIEENAKCNYNCKFPIKTEVGLLYNFAKQLPKLNEQEVGICVHLWE